MLRSGLRDGQCIVLRRPAAFLFDLQILFHQILKSPAKPQHISVWKSCVSDIQDKLQLLNDPHKLSCAVQDKVAVKNRKTNQEEKTKT